MTNKLNTLTFANESELAYVLEETLPDYLSLTTLYPSVLVPIIVIFLLLLIMFCCLRKVSILQNYLNKQIHKEKKVQKRKGQIRRADIT